MSRILVTGGAGFIGSHLVDSLIKDKHQVVIIDNLSTGRKEFINKKARFIKCDIRDFKKIFPLFKSVSAVFHAAADPRVQMSIEKPLDTHATNVTGTLNVLWASKKAGVKKVIFLSSCTVYGECAKLPIKEDVLCMPVSPYGLHKLMGEQYMRLFALQFGVSAAVLRLFNVYGPRKLSTGSYPMVIPTFIKQFRDKQSLTIVGDGEQTRDYVHVSDVVRACKLVWQSRIANGDAFNIAGGKEISVNDIAALIGGKTAHLPHRPGEMRFVAADISRAKQLLNWSPNVDFKRGLNKLLRYDKVNL